MRPFLVVASVATASFLIVGGLAAASAGAAVTVRCGGGAAALTSAVTRSAGRLTVNLVRSCAYRVTRPLRVDGALVIHGNGATLKPAPGFRGPLIADRGTLIADDLNVTGGQTAIAVTGHGRLTVNGGRFSGMTSQAITIVSNDPGETDITEATLADNGGGVYYDDGNGGLVITGCRFTGNNRGSIWEFALYGEVDHTVMTGNTTSGDGGAIWADDDDGPGLTGDTFSRNTAGGDGGAVFVAGGGGAPDLTRTLVSGNHAGGDGGGLYVDSNQGFGGALVTDSLITGNTAHGDGGGVWNIGATFTGSQVSGNKAGRDGGGIYVPAGSDGEDDFYSTAVAANQAAREGGGILRCPEASGQSI